MANPPRRWMEKFGDAVRGIWLGARRHSSFRVHLAVTVLVLIAAVASGCTRIEWGLLLSAIGLVLTAELLNCALETLFHALDDATKGRVKGCLDLAAGAVLLAALTAAAIGALVFVPKIWLLVT